MMHPRMSYLVCATPRSGSSLLCEVLDTSHVAGHPQEFFGEGFEPVWRERWGASDYRSYLGGAIEEGTTSNGVFGAKIMRSHLDDFLDRVREALGLGPVRAMDALDAIFPDLRYIWITRRDTVRQAVSHARAEQTGIWNEDGNVRDRTVAPVYDFARIGALVRQIEEHNESWDGFFRANRIEPLHVVYEDLARYPEVTGVEVLRWLGVEVLTGARFRERRLRKQADGLSEEWVERYRDESEKRIEAAV